MKEQSGFSTEVAIIYRKTDGHIARVMTLSEHVRGKITEKDIRVFFPNVEDISNFGLVFIKGKQYLEIDRYRIEVDVEGNFVNIVGKADSFVPLNEDEVQVNPNLLDREVEIVISVLNVVDNLARLLKFKELEERGRNRPEIMNFFKEKGI